MNIETIINGQNIKSGDRIIWDSGFGYELGFFIEKVDEEKRIMNYDTRVRLYTGVIRDVTLKPCSEIHLCTTENLSKVNNKYVF
jgi:hypothetical protein